MFLLKTDNESISMIIKEADFLPWNLHGYV